MHLRINLSYWLRNSDDDYAEFIDASGRVANFILSNPSRKNIACLGLLCVIPSFSVVTQPELSTLEKKKQTKTKHLHDA